MAILLRHAKANFSALSPDLYLWVTFGADSISIDAASAEDLAAIGAGKSLNSTEQIFLAIQQGDGSTAKSLAEELDMKLNTVQNCLSKLTQGRRILVVGKAGHAPN